MFSFPSFFILYFFYFFTVSFSPSASEPVNHVLTNSLLLLFVLTINVFVSEWIGAKIKAFADIIPLHLIDGKHSQIVRSFQKQVSATLVLICQNTASVTSPKGHSFLIIINTPEVRLYDGINDHLCVQDTRSSCFTHVCFSSFFPPTPLVINATS
jgi:hypothetical protein